MSHCQNVEVFDESVNVTSTNRGFQTVEHSVATYQQPRKDYHTFTPGEI